MHFTSELETVTVDEESGSVSKGSTPESEPFLCSRRMDHLVEGVTECYAVYHQVKERGRAPVRLVECFVCWFVCLLF